MASFDKSRTRSYSSSIVTTAVLASLPRHPFSINNSLPLAGKRLRIFSRCFNNRTRSLLYCANSPLFTGNSTASQTDGKAVSAKC